MASAIHIMKNSIQEYAWGSVSAIPELMGIPASKTPMAELWMGAHPKAPSEIDADGGWKPLDSLINASPEQMLGSACAEKFEGRLPYLLKVLASASPLSIQAHPDKAQAETGWKRENAEGIPPDAPHRNYRDDNHKPECICALTPFWALCGFRPVSGILSLMGRVCPESFKEVLSALEQDSQTDAPAGLKTFFQSLMTLSDDQRAALLEETLSVVRFLADESPIFKWVLKLNRAYPGDIGILSPLYLNLVCLEPGQALFLPAGELHSYLDGVGIELMANSDNVLRGGLTPKHVDVPELLNILNFSARQLKILTPRHINGAEWAYESHAEEFRLSFGILHKNEAAYSIEKNDGPEILLCTKGEMAIQTGSDAPVHFGSGASVWVPADVPSFRVEGDGVFYRASVNL